MPRAGSNFSRTLGGDNISQDVSRAANIGENNQSVRTASDQGLEGMLGSIPSFNGRQRAGEQFSKETWDGSDRYADETEWLTGVLDWAIRENADFWCTQILPWKCTESLHFAWNVWKFDRTIMDIEPHQGVPRLVTSSRESRSSSLIRRGLAFMIEHGFYNTDQGRETFALNIKQIADAVQTTCYSDVLHSLLQSDNYYKDWHLKFGMPGRRQDDIAVQERRRWSIVSKSPKGLYLLDADLKREFRREGITPSQWIWPDRMMVYLQMVPESNTVFSQRGPGAHEALAGKIQSSFRGLPVQTAYPLDVDFNGRPLSLLERDRMIGEWFHIRPTEKIHIFDAGRDRFVAIDYVDALKCNLAAYEGADPSPHSKSLDLAELYKKILGLPLVNTTLDLLKPFLMNEKTATELTTFIGNLAAPVAGDGGDSTPNAELINAFPTLMLLRPFQTWRMASCILCRGGSELGNTMHGHHDMQLQNDAIRKIMVGHYTFYSRAVVKNSKMVSVVEDVFANDYVTGESADLFDDPADFTGSWHSQEIGTKKCHKSILVWGIGSRATLGDTYKDPEDMSDCVDILGNFPDAEQYSIDDIDMFHGVSKLERRLGLSSLRPQRVVESNLYLKSHQTLNTVCFKGHTIRNGYVSQRGRGHWGADVYEGVAAHRTGMSGDGFVRQVNVKVELQPDGNGNKYMTVAESSR